MWRNLSRPVATIANAGGLFGFGIEETSDIRHLTEQILRTEKVIKIVEFLSTKIDFSAIQV